MRKYTLIILSFLLVLLCGCGSKEDEPLTCKYKLTYNVEDRLNVITSAVVYEYSEKGEKIAYNNIPRLYDGFWEYYTADKNAVKVKVYITLRSTAVDVEQNWWVGIVYYLTPGETKEIVIDGDTRMNKNEP